MGAEAELVGLALVVFEAERESRPPPRDGGKLVGGGRVPAMAAPVTGDTWGDAKIVLREGGTTETFDMPAC